MYRVEDTEESYCGQRHGGMDESGTSGKAVWDRLAVTWP